MKRYRLMDWYGEPYHAWYNETNLRNIAECLADLLQTEDREFIYDDWEPTVEKIYQWLLKWERDFIIMVEECDEPFESEWEYWWDDCWHNFSREEILQYASTRDDLWTYDKENLVDYVWSFSTHNWLKNKPLSEILDEYSMIDVDCELFDCLNNLLFNKYSQLVNCIKERFNKNRWIEIDDDTATYYASKFVDCKELYDLDYDD